MIVDSSAMVAIIRAEPEAARLAALLSASQSVRMSAATLVELSIVIDRDSVVNSSSLLDDLIDRSGIHIEAFTAEQATVARRAYASFGKGSGHRAGLNFGDCFAYALAKVTGEPLLFTGDDFVHTDVTCA